MASSLHTGHESMTLFCRGSAILLFWGINAQPNGSHLLSLWPALTGEKSCWQFYAQNTWFLLGLNWRFVFANSSVISTKSLLCWQLELNCKLVQRKVRCTYLHERGDLHGNLRADTLQEESQHLDLEGESGLGVATGTSVLGVVRSFYRNNWPWTWT